MSSQQPFANEKTRKTFKRLVLPLLAIVIFFLLHRTLGPVGNEYLTVLLWLATTLFATRLLGLLLFQRLPGPMVDLCVFVVWLVSVIAYLSMVFGFNMTTFTTTSSVSIAVLGFALRGLLLDFFTGIAMSIEHPYDLGDWIEVENRVGKVVETNWRITRILTRDNVLIVVPNSKLAFSTFKNFSKPFPHFRDSFSVTLDYEIDPARVERLLLGAAKELRAVAEAPIRPDLKIAEFDDEGVKWMLRYCVSDYESRDNIKYAIQRNILRNFYFTGIRPASEKIEATVNKPASRNQGNQDALFFLQLVDIFKPLSKTDLETLAGTLVRKRFGQDSVIVRQGDYGDSLFILVEGLLVVSVMDSGGNRKEVKRITPGTCFGEFSLLTGSPRTASVQAEVDSIVYEVTKADCRPIIEGNEQLMTRLGTLLAQRQLELSDRLGDGPETRKDSESLAAVLIKKIADFFGIREPA